MRLEEFKRLPWLLFKGQVTELLGYSDNTLDKMVDCQVLRCVKPAGLRWDRFQKAQVAKMLGWGIEELGAEEFGREPMLMPEKGVTVWTGLCDESLGKVVAAGGLVLVRPAGLRCGRYRKAEVAELIGLAKYV